MSTQIITLEIPAALYARMMQRAERSQRSVEAEFLNVLTHAVSEPETLPSELAQAIEALERLDDDQLWKASREHLPNGISEELEALNLKQQRLGLTAIEQQRADELGFEYDRAMLVRARAAVLLRERGYDVSSLLGSS
jgi:plasmid stability protein